MKKVRISAILLALVGAFQLLAPSLVRACFVCFGGEDNDWTDAFVSGTAVMLGLPPAIILGASFVIYRSVKRTEALRAAEDQAEQGSSPNA